MKNFKVIKSETLFRGKVFDLQVDQIEYNSGNPGVREIAIHPGGAVVVPIKNDGKIVFVKQFRYPLQKVLLELPAGKLEVGEDPMKCAVRELEEETGYKAEEITKLGAIYTTPGFCTEVLHIYLAKGLTPGNHNREEGEHGMEVLELTKEEIEDKIKNGELVDAKSLSGILMAKVN
ncbi:MAG: NUDIX hydrolase [Ignavibacteria bacterium]|jgi:ADP-ribose pyrophosphatase|nr:NUDIX hydrolase [Ignavibacteria bacterium]MCU7499223.1 NUDIX hydrolase [Ignavibacteria bacterium]MCU7520100.1 NUDIX hydrolase [Ignavibacteria bacterium]MCU7524605.1 NUDIX hydrolase [Ignavibacteria bacterium]HEX2961197.1 NUDIX hydrolase [Ignavibacteriales bacterium]